MAYSYLVSYGSTASGPWTAAGSVSSLSDTISGLTGGSTYYFRVIPVDGATGAQGQAVVSSAVTIPTVTTSTPATAKATILAWLIALQTKGVISIQHIGGQQTSLQTVNAVYAASGQYVGGIGGGYYDDNGYDANFSSVFNATAISYWNAGGLVTISQGWPNPAGGGALTTTGLNVNDLLTAGSSTQQAWLSILDDNATALLELQNAGVVTLLRPLHEMNGTWNWWGVENFSSAQFIQLWQLTYNYLVKTKGLTSLIWVYASNGGTLSCYPGDAYVDIVGFDDYTDTPANDVGATYTPFLTPNASINYAANKPIAYCEFGSGSSKMGDASFDETVLINCLQNNMPRCIYWCQWWDGNGGNLGWGMDTIQNISGALNNSYVRNRGNLGRPSLAVTSNPSTGPASSTPSAAGTTVTNTTGVIYDSAGTAWTLVASATNFQAQHGGITDSANLTELLYFNNLVYTETATGVWSYWNASTNAYVATTNPQVSVSPSGTTVTAPGAGSIVDSTNVVWTLVNSTSNGVQISHGGTIDGANVVLLLYYNNLVYQTNQAGGWWYWDVTQNPANYTQTTGDPRGTASVTTPPVVTGSGLIASGQISTSGNQLVNSSGVAQRIAGVVWGGTETASGHINYLDTTNYQSMIQAIVALGFNVVRLEMDDLAILNGIQCPNLNTTINPDLAGLTVLQIIVKMVTYAGTLGLRFIIDSHSNAGGVSQQSNGLWYGAGGVTATTFQNRWTTLATALKGNAGLLGYDLRHEPSTGTATTGGIVPPPAAAAAGFTTLAFADDFTSASTIDSGNTTSSSGYNWYTYQTQAAGTNYNVLTTTTAAQVANGNSGGGSNASAAGGIWELMGSSALSNNMQFFSVPTANWGTAGSVGTWQHFYAEAYCQFNASGSSSNGWPAFWSYSTQDVAASGGTGTEVDFLEVDAGGAYGGTVHIDSGAAAPGTPIYRHTPDSNWHTYGFLWVSTGSGTGQISMYYDNVQVGSTLATGTGSNIAQLESDNLFIAFGTGVGWPMYVDWCRVWTSGAGVVPGTPSVSTTSGNISGINWGSGNATDLHAMYQTVGNAILAIDSTPLIICEGPQMIGVSNLAGTSTAGAPEGDLSLVASKPVVLNIANRVVYSIHYYPTATANPTEWMLNWGSVFANGVAPLYVGACGSLDQAATSAEQTALTTFCAFLNGTYSGGPTISSTQQGIGTTWFEWAAIGYNNNQYLVATSLVTPTSLLPAVSSFLTSLASRTTSSNFYVSGGKVYDPNGKLYVAKGVCLLGPALNVISTNSAAQPLTSLFPGINHVRLPVYPSSPGTSAAQYPAPSTYLTFVEQLTGYTLNGSTWVKTNNNAIVVEIEDHNQNDQDYDALQPYTGQALTVQLAWYTAMATYYAGNPYVWLGGPNEMASADYSQAAIALCSTWEGQIYNAIRSGTNNNNMIQFMAGVGGSNIGTVGVDGGFNPATFANMTNIVWEIHCYYSSGDSEGSIYNTVAGYVNGGTSAPASGAGGGWGIIGAQTIQSKDGIVPVIIGEWGSDSGNPNSTEASLIAGQVLAVQSQGVGHTAWCYGGQDGMQWAAVNGEGALSTYGQEVATTI